MLNWVNSGFNDILAEMETSEPVRNWWVSGRLFTEPGKKFRACGHSSLALGFPVRNETLWVDGRNDAFVNVHYNHFLFLERCQFSMPKRGWTSLSQNGNINHRWWRTSCHKEWIRWEGNLMPANNRTPDISATDPPLKDKSVQDLEQLKHALSSKLADKPDYFTSYIGVTSDHSRRLFSYLYRGWLWSFTLAIYRNVTFHFHVPFHFCT
jgi:hypothetical protein